VSFSERIVDAMALAVALHGSQTRKCSDVPYITHLLAVAALVGEYGGSEDQFIAALLHDAVEDQGGLEILDQIRAQFGPAVAELVWACTDAWEEPKPPWRQRKEAHIARIPDTPPEARLIIAADKLHNLRSMIQTYPPGDDGPYWRNFRGGKEGSLWYYDAMGEALRTGWDHPIQEELEDCLNRFKARL